jgi:hypothetical protein
MRKRWPRAVLEKKRRREELAVEGARPRARILGIFE